MVRLLLLQVAAAAPRDDLRPHQAVKELALRAVAALAAGASAGAFRVALAPLPPEAKLRLQARLLLFPSPVLEAIGNRWCGKLCACKARLRNARWLCLCGQQCSGPPLYIVKLLLLGGHVHLG